MRYIIIASMILTIMLQGIAQGHDELSRNDTDFFVLPPIKPTGLIYAGRFYPPQPRSFKWIAVSDRLSLRFRGKVVIYQYSYSFKEEWGRALNNRGVPMGGPHPNRGCYTSAGIRPIRRYGGAAWFKKRVIHNGGGMCFVIYYTGKVEIHKDEKDEKAEKTESQMSAKPKRFKRHSHKETCEPLREKRRKECSKQCVQSR